MSSNSRLRPSPFLSSEEIWGIKSNRNKEEDDSRPSSVQSRNKQIDFMPISPTSSVFPHSPASSFFKASFSLASNLRKASISFLALGSETSSLAPRTNSACLSPKSASFTFSSESKSPSQSPRSITSSLSPDSESSCVKPELFELSPVPTILLQTDSILTTPTFDDDKPAFEKDQLRICIQERKQRQSVHFEKRESVAWQMNDERGYRVLQGMDRYGATPEAFTKDDSNDEGRTRNRRISYIEGIRGIIGVQTLLWIFFRIFAPAIVVDRDVDGVYPATFINESAQWMSLVRQILSPLLFDGDLQMTMFLILSGRVVLLTFLERREPLALAGPCFRRPFRLFFPVAVTLAIVSALNATNCFKYASFMADHLHNQAAQAPQKFTSVLEYWNSLATFFFAPTTQMDARAVAFIPPSGISWYLEVVFQQVYVLTVYAWILPFVTLKYKVVGVVSMIALSAWVGRWSWYTLTGLAIAEFAVVYKQMLMPGSPKARRLSVAGLRKNSNIVWLVPALFTILGVFLKFFWADAFPKQAPYEIIAHASQDNAGLNYDTNPLTTAYPRYDNWLLCTGLLLLVELSPRAQRLLSCKSLVYLGRLSFSIALTSGTIMLSLGSVVYYCLYQALGVTDPATITGILFVFVLPLCLLFAHVFSAIVDDASLLASRFIFRVSRS